MLKDKLVNKIREALVSNADHLEYEKIHKFMKDNDWYYGSVNEGTPSVQELQSVVFSLVCDAMNCFQKELDKETKKDYSRQDKLPFIYVSTGGFSVMIHPWSETEIIFAASSDSTHISLTREEK